MNATRSLSHAEVNELAGLYVLSALAPAELEAVREHLASCPQEHPDFAELGGVVPALAATIEPIEAPAALRGRVLAAIATEAAADGRDSKPERAPETERPASAAPRRFGMTSWLGWAAAAASVLLVAVVGAWALAVQARNVDLERRQALIAEAFEARAADNAQVATLSGTGPASGATGFAAFTPEGEGYILLGGLPPAPPGQTYQAWYIVDGNPVSAGVLNVGDDGLALLSGVSPPTGTQLIALTIERAGGAEQPTSDPIIAGNLQA